MALFDNLANQLQFVNSATAWDRAYNYAIFDRDGYTPNSDFVHDRKFQNGINPAIQDGIIDSLKPDVSSDGSSSFYSLLQELLGDVTSDPKDPPSGLSQDTFQYLNAELAKAYGMDRATAYQEALSNSEYQRAVADMKAAGLNPAAIFGRGSGSTAATFSGSAKSVSGSGSKKSTSDLASFAGSVVTLLSLLGSDGSSAKVAGNAAKAVADFLLD